MKTPLFIVPLYRRVCVWVIALTFLGLGSKELFGDVAYLQSNTGSLWSISPSDLGSNETAMNTVFGANNWNDLRLETVDTSLLFSSKYTFIFLEGGHTTADGLKNFLSVNEALIATWVSNGGSLFLNAAPNQGSGMSYGFGITLNYSNPSTISAAATAVNGSHPIFNGPYGETGLEFGGTQFSHATVSGTGLTPLITGTAGTILAEMNYGDGHILFGGMTPSYYHTPKPESYDLLANILAHGAGITSPIPEPSSYALMAAVSALGLVAIRRRR